MSAAPRPLSVARAQEDVPAYLLIRVFDHLSLSEIAAAALSCKSWLCSCLAVKNVRPSIPTITKIRTKTDLLCVLRSPLRKYVRGLNLLRLMPQHTITPRLVQRTVDALTNLDEFGYIWAPPPPAASADEEDEDQPPLEQVIWPENTQTKLWKLNLAMNVTPQTFARLQGVIDALPSSIRELTFSSRSSGANMFAELNLRHLASGMPQLHLLILSTMINFNPMGFSLEQIRDIRHSASLRILRQNVGAWSKQQLVELGQMPLWDLDLSAISYDYQTQPMLAR